MEFISHVLFCQIYAYFSDETWCYQAVKKFV